MNNIPPLICPACGAGNEPNTNFCDQCSATLQDAPAAGPYLANRSYRAPKEALVGALTGITVVAVIVALCAALILFHHHSHQPERVATSDSWTEERKWLAWANTLEAEAITGHGIPSHPALWDVISYEGIHELYFADWKSRETMTVRFADSQSDMTLGQMMSVRNAFVHKVIAQQDSGRTATQGSNAVVPKMLGQKQIRLASGEAILVERVLVALPNGATAKGMQVRLTMNGKVYHIAADGEPLTETEFIDFLNQWRSSPLTQKLSDRLTAHEKSIAYTKRGELLANLTFRRPEALKCFEKAIQFDPKNSEARLQVQLWKVRRRIGAVEK